MKRRDFLKTSLATSALAAASLPASSAVQAPTTGQEYYELKVFRLKAGATAEVLDDYLGQHAIPRLEKMGIGPIGAFKEAQPKETVSISLLLPAARLEVLAKGRLSLSHGPSAGSGEKYAKLAKNEAAYDRIDSWLMVAFAGMPKLEQAAFSKAKAKDRLFELRTYESYSEAKAQKKVDMFNDGEIEVMRDVGLAPFFFGQAFSGANLPHLTYMTGGETEELHKQHWDAFGKHPTWNKMKNDPQYADTVSKITKWMLKPTEYSRI